MYATCETPNCGMRGMPAPALALIAVVCGACGNEITNVSETAPEPVTEVPEWLL